MDPEYPESMISVVFFFSFYVVDLLSLTFIRVILFCNMTYNKN